MISIHIAFSSAFHSSPDFPCGPDRPSSLVTLWAQEGTCPDWVGRWFRHHQCRVSLGQNGWTIFKHIYLYNIYIYIILYYIILYYIILYYIILYYIILYYIYIPYIYMYYLCIILNHIWKPQPADLELLLRPPLRLRWWFPSCWVLGLRDL